MFYESMQDDPGGEPLAAELGRVADMLDHLVATDPAGLSRAVAALGQLAEQYGTHTSGGRFLGLASDYLACLDFVKTVGRASAQRGRGDWVA